MSFGDLLSMPGRKLAIGFAGRRVKWAFVAAWGDVEKRRPALPAPVRTLPPPMLPEAA